MLLTNMNEPLIASLTAIGLSDKEARVFLALMELGQGTASAIAEKAKIKRAIAYFTLRNLIENGYAREVAGYRVKRYEAAPAGRLLQRVQANVENFRMMMPLLNAMQGANGDKPRIELFDGKEGILTAYRSMEFARRSCYLTNWNAVQSSFPEEVRRWAKNAANVKNPNEVRNLIADDATGREMARAMKGNPKQQFRLLPKDVRYGMNFGIADNTVAITSFDPLFAVVITSKEVAQCMSIIFELAWRTAKPIKK